MSQSNTVSHSFGRAMPGGWRGWLGFISGTVTVVAVGYLPAWLVLNSFVDSPTAEDAMGVAYIATLFCASVTSLVAGLVNRHSETQHGIMRLPHGLWSLTAVALMALFVPSVIIATGDTLLDAMSAWGYTGESSLYMAIQSTAGWLTILSGVGGLGAAIVALFRKDRSLALMLPIGAGLVVVGFVVGELIGHA